MRPYFAVTAVAHLPPAHPPVHSRAVPAHPQIAPAKLEDAKFELSKTCEISKIVI